MGKIRHAKTNENVWTVPGLPSPPTNPNQLASPNRDRHNGYRVPCCKPGGTYLELEESSGVRWLSVGTFWEDQDIVFGTQFILQGDKCGNVPVSAPYGHDSAPSCEATDHRPLEDFRFRQDTQFLCKLSADGKRINQA